MKKVTTTGIVAVGLLLSCAPLAVAESTPSPRASENLDSMSYKSALDKYQAARKNYSDLIKANEDKRRLANQVFKAAMQKIMSDSSKNAKGATNSPELKRQAMAARQNAIVAASAVRDLAHAEIGPTPTPPEEPIKPAKDARTNPADQGALDAPVKPARERKGKNR